MEEIHIQLLKDLDEKAFSEAAEAYANAFNNAGVGETWGKEKTEKYFQYNLECQPDLFFVATENNHVIGGIMGEVRRLNNQYLFVNDLFVDPVHQGKGIATKLMKHLLTTVKEKYPETDGVDTLADGNKPFPMEWYNKLGMQETGWTHISGPLDKVLEAL